MKLFCFLLFFLTSHALLALSVSVNTGSIRGSKYSLLHLEGETEFMCLNETDSHDVTIQYLCEVPPNIFVSNFNKNEYDFLSINIATKDNKTYLVITPKSKFSQIHSVKIGAFEAQATIPKAKSDIWSIYFTNNEENLIYNKTKKPQGLDFQIDFREVRPFIGTLDEDKRPLTYNDGKEIQALMGIKKLYDNKEYIPALSDISITRDQYPNSVFMKDYILYALRSYNQINDENKANDVVDLALKWLEDNPSDQSIPEVLYYLGTAYSTLFKATKSSQVFHQLIQSYPNHKFQYRAKLTLGDNLRSSDNLTESIRLYEDVLYNTQDLEIALMAAERIAEKSLDDGFLQKAKAHYQKIIDKNIDFLLTDLDKGYALAVRLNTNDFPDLAVQLLDRLLIVLEQSADIDEHARVLFETAELYEGLDVYQAIEYYQQYLDVHPQGLSINLAKERLDKLLFNSHHERNLTDDEILANIEYILKTYPNHQIAKKAFYKKMQIYYKREMYSEVLANETEINELTEDVAIDKVDFLHHVKNDYALHLLTNKYCEIYARTVERYELVIGAEHDNESFKCMFSQFRYDAARVIVDRRLSNPDEDNKLLWLYRLSQLFVKHLDYENMVYVITDLLDITKEMNIENAKYQETIYDLFFAYDKLRDEDNVLIIGTQIEQTYKNDIRNIRVFKTMMQIAEANLDTSLMIFYGDKIIALQKLYKSYIESPWVDFVLVKSYSEYKEYEQALTILDNLGLIYKKVPSINIAKVRYLQSDIYRKMGDSITEKNLLEECATFQDAIWPDVCKNTLKWISFNK